MITHLSTQPSMLVRDLRSKLPGKSRDVMLWQRRHDGRVNGAHPMRAPAERPSARGWPDRLNLLPVPICWTELRRRESPGRSKVS